MGVVDEAGQALAQRLHQPLVALEVVVLVVEVDAAVRRQPHAVVGHRQVLGDHQHREHPRGRRVGERVGHQRRRQPVGDLALQRLAGHVFQQLDVAHRQVEAAARVASSRSRSPPASWGTAPGSARRSARPSRSGCGTCSCGRPGRSRWRGRSGAPRWPRPAGARRCSPRRRPATTMSPLQRSSPCSVSQTTSVTVLPGRVGLQPHRLAAGQQRDVRQAQQRLDGDACARRTWPSAGTDSRRRSCT